MFMDFRTMIEGHLVTEKLATVLENHLRWRNKYKNRQKQKHYAAWHTIPWIFLQMFSVYRLDGSIGSMNCQQSVFVYCPAKNITRSHDRTSFECYVRMPMHDQILFVIDVPKSIIYLINGHIAVVRRKTTCTHGTNTGMFCKPVSQTHLRSWVV